VSALAVVVTVDSTSAGAARGNPPTQITVVRPVNAAGYPVSNYTVTGEPTGGVSCSFPDPAPSAVSPNIEQCSPSAAYPVACWKAAAPHKVLCLRNPRARKLVRIPRIGAFAPTSLAPAEQRAPLSMVLANGDYCSFRIGGAAPFRMDHPQWIATYYCNSGKIVWMRPGAHHYGVNERFDSWIVIVAGATGPIFARHLLRAWFVGTYQGG
jgi:hypothetical protein